MDHSKIKKYAKRLVIALLALSILGVAGLALVDYVSAAGKRDFFKKYEVYHMDKFLGKKLFVNDKEVKEFPTSNVFYYGDKGNYYWMEDNTQKDITCEGAKLPRLTEDGEGKILGTDSKNNIWCIHYRDKEYTANSQPLLINDDSIVYTKCEKSKFLETLDRNGCVLQSLLLNGEKIDSTGPNINAYDKKEHLVNDFDQFSTDKKQIIYSKDPDGFVSYDIQKKTLTKNEPKNLNEYESIQDIKISDGKLGIVTKTPAAFEDQEIEWLGKWIKVPKSYQYNLSVNGKEYADIAGFNLKGNDVYYLKAQKELEEKEAAYYKMSLIKNDQKIADFFIRQYAYSDGVYLTSGIALDSECLPRNDVCIYKDGSTLIYGIKYDGSVDASGYRLYPNIYKINNAEIVTDVIPSTVTPIFDENGLKYTLLTGWSEVWLKDMRDLSKKEINLFAGDRPQFIKKR